MYLICYSKKQAESVIFVNASSVEEFEDCNAKVEKYKEALNELGIKVWCEHLVYIEDEFFDEIQEDNFKSYFKYGTEYLY